MHSKLRAEEVTAGLADLQGWAFDADRPAIAKDFKFANFAAAWSFMSACALWAEKHDHHPEWFNVYNRVSVVLTTHDASGVTELDMNFARYMNTIGD